MLKLDDQTLEDMSFFLSGDTRLKLLDKLTKLSGKRPREKISMRLEIAKPHVYRYLPKDKKSKRRVPKEKITGKIIRELLKEGATSSMITELDKVETRLRRVSKRYYEWKKEMKKRSLYEDPLSKSSIRNLERSF